MPLSLASEEQLRRFNAAADAAPSEIWITRRPGQIFGTPGTADRPLAGRLVAVKDNIDVLGFPTTVGCPDMAFEPTRSATVVERLAGAGAIVVGKTNLDQFACGLVGTRSPFGTVPNAFRAEYVSGGSSSGSAVAVALGLVDIALGTDTAGSGRVPAGFNNIVGVKPSRGLISAAGVFPACQHLDCVSIFTRNVPLAAQVLEVCAGYDAGDPFSRALVLDAGFMPQRFRFGVPDAAHLEFFGDRHAGAAFAQALRLLANLGGSEQAIDFSVPAEAAAALYEGAWVAERYAAVRTFFDAQPESVHPVVRAIFERAKHHSAADLFAQMVQMGDWCQFAMGLWSELDVLVVPTAPTHPTIAQALEEPFDANRRLGYYTNFVNLLELAAVSVPAAMRPDGLPFGITLIGPACSEWRLLDLAQRFHLATGLTEGALEVYPPGTVELARPIGSTVRVVVVGAHLAGLPLNGQLQARAARLISAVKTAPKYRLYALTGSRPPKPGLLRSGIGKPGVAIDAELWEMPLAHLGSFVAGIPAPLCVGTIELADGTFAQGFLCEAAGINGALDISHFGGWRAYLAHASATQLAS